jgi:hypothetical protein
MILTNPRNSATERRHILAKVYALLIRLAEDNGNLPKDPGTLDKNAGNPGAYKVKSPCLQSKERNQP